MMKKFLTVCFLCLSVFVVSCDNTDPVVVTETMIQVASTDLSTYISDLKTLGPIAITSSSDDDITFASSAYTSDSADWTGDGLILSTISDNIETAALDLVVSGSGIAGVVVFCNDFDGSETISSSGGEDSDGVYTFTLYVAVDSGYVLSSSATSSVTLTLTVDDSSTSTSSYISK